MRRLSQVLFLCILLVPLSLFAQANDEARFVNGDLVPPLPSDPAKRAAAVRALSGQGVGAPAANVIRPGAGRQVQATEAAAQIMSTPEDRQRSASSVAPRNAAGSSVSAATLTSLGGFPGFDDTGTDPADVHIAAGPDYVVGVVNSVVGVWDKCGNFMGSLGFSTLVGGAPGVYYGGRVIYDEWNQRYCLAFIRYDTVGGQGYVYWAYSTDPTAPWTYYPLGAPFVGAGFFPDFIDIGADLVNVYLTYNRFSTSTFAFVGCRLSIADAVDFYDGGSTTFPGLDFGNNPGDGQPASAVRVAKMRSWGGSQYMINALPSGGDFVTFWTYTGDAATGVLTPTNIPFGATYSPGLPGPQSDGTYIEMGDARFYDASYFQNRLQAVGGYTGRAIAFWELEAVGAVGSFYGSRTAGRPGVYSGFPAVDVDSDQNVFISYAGVDSGGSPGFPSARVEAYEDICCGVEELVVAPGLANYAGSGAGTSANPYRWGHTSGACTDPSGDRVWVMGMFASDNPTPSWDTRIELVTFGTAPNMTLTALGGLTTISGVEGGPFEPLPLVYQVENTGGVTGNWELTNTPWFLVPSKTGGELAPAASDFITFTLQPGVLATPGPLTDTQPVSVHQCLGGPMLNSNVTLVIGVEPDCTLGPLDLAPAFPPTGQLSGVMEEHGIYLTSMRTFVMCGVSFVADLPPGTTVRSRGYEAVGTTRGAQLWDKSIVSYKTGMATHNVPISLQFIDCADYNVSFEVDAANGYEYWDESSGPYSVDHASLIRTRDGDLAGNPSATERIHIKLLGTEFPCDNQTDLAPAGATVTVLPTLLTDRGMYVTALRTMRLCSVLFNANLPANAIVTARVYEAAGLTTRGALIGEGSFISAGPGLQVHGAPVNAVLLEGEIYNISIDYGTAADIEVFDETAITLPYDVADVMRVRDGEVGGNANADIYLPNFDIEWGEVGGGNFIGLSPPTGTESIGTNDNDGRGLYVTPFVDQQVYAVSWEADVPDGEVIQCGVFDGTGGFQGALISFGTIFSGGPGRRWHTVPVSVEFEAGKEYNVVTSWADVNGYTQWTGSSFTYLPNGITKVLGASDEFGSPASEVVHLRYRTCGGEPVGTAILDTPLHTPMYLRPPSPNPASGFTTLSFQLEDEGPVTMAVYDVTGRHVADVVSGSTLPSGPHERLFDTSGIASGVYFVKLQTANATVTRKLVVSR